MVNREIVVAKMANIEKSLGRLTSKQGISYEDFFKDRDIQDIVLLNLQTAIQGCIDIASHIVSDNSWGVPGSLAGLFDILAENKVLTKDMAATMRSMVGFRNLIVHEYAGLDMQKVYELFCDRLGDFNEYLKEISIYLKL